MNLFGCNEDVDNNADAAYNSYLMFSFIFGMGNFWMGNFWLPIAEAEYISM